jgi:hypothetical protein
MALSFPLSWPGPVPRGLTPRAVSNAGISTSPFTFEQEIQAAQGARWELDVHLPPMPRATAAACIGALVGLDGVYGTLLLSLATMTSPLGTWSGGSPLINGASQSGKTIVVDGLAAGATGKSGDLFSLGSGASTHLHMVTKDFTANGSGQVAALEIWPPLRSSPADNAPLTLSSPMGLWRLKSNVREWSIELAAIYGLDFSLVEAL